jgi:hypothetical protein
LLLAIITHKPLELDWLPADPEETPARVLNETDLETLVTRLQALALDRDRWIVFSTRFEVTA